VVERDFTLKGTMKSVSPGDKRRLQGHLPFYSVDTREEADALIKLALETGEFTLGRNGVIIETRLAQEQTLERLNEAGEALAVLHAALVADMG
jgi:hypothetical protein